MDLRDKAQRWLKRAQDLLALPAAPQQQQQQQQQQETAAAAATGIPQQQNGDGTAQAAVGAETPDGENAATAAAAAKAAAAAGAAAATAAAGTEGESLAKALRPLLPCSANTIRLAALLLLESDSVCCCSELETRLEQLLLYALWRHRVARLRCPANDAEIAELLAAPQIQRCKPALSLSGVSLCLPLCVSLSLSLSLSVRLSSLLSPGHFILL